VKIRGIIIDIQEEPDDLHLPAMYAARLAEGYEAIREQAVALGCSLSVSIIRKGVDVAPHVLKRWAQVCVPRATAISPPDSEMTP
jgi:hypothetical protein